MVEFQPRDISGGIGDAEVSGNNSALTPGVGAFGDQQGEEVIGYESPWEADRLHVARAGTCVGTARCDDFADHQGRRGREEPAIWIFCSRGKDHGGVPIKATINANTARVDFLDLSRGAAQ